MPEILLNLLDLKPGDYVYIPLDSINREMGIEVNQISKPIIEQSGRQIIEQRQMIESDIVFQNRFEETKNTNPLFKKAYEKLSEFTKDNHAYPKKPQKSMIAFYTPKGGLCWLEYKSPGAIPFTVHLAKGKYMEVDPLKKVIYDSETKKTWGGYPIFLVEREADIEYFATLVKFAINNNY